MISHVPATFYPALFSCTRPPGPGGGGVGVGGGGRRGGGGGGGGANALIEKKNHLNIRDLGPL
jgi:hypothetical protein